MYWNIWKRKSKKNLQSYKRLNDIRIFLHFLNSKISDNKLSACILTGTLILENKKTWQCRHAEGGNASENKFSLYLLENFNYHYIVCFGYP